MVGLIVWLAGLPYHGPIRHYPCDVAARVTTVYDRTTDGRPVKVALDESSDQSPPRRK